jgi:HEAT repeat protein
MNDPDALVEMVTLLVDREADARIGAVRALAYSEKPEAVLLIRLKVLVGDASAEVLGECFTALIALAPEKSVPFVAGYLDGGDPAIAEAAALALGQSRQSPAIEVLIRKWQPRLDESLRRALLLALALARQESAFEFLFSLVAGGSRETAAEAIAALAMYRHDDHIRGRAEALVTGRKERQLEDVLRAEFGQGHAHSSPTE